MDRGEWKARFPFARAYFGGFAVAFVPLAGLGVFLQFIVTGGAPTFLWWFLAVSAIGSGAIDFYAMRISTVRSLHVTADGVVLRPGTSRAELWTWDRIEPPKVAAIDRIFATGLIAIGLRSGPFVLQVCRLTRLQAFTVIDSPSRPNWPLSADIAHRLGLSSERGHRSVR